MPDSDPPSAGADTSNANAALAAAVTPEKPKDVVFVHGQTPHGLGIARLREGEDGESRVELGELRAIKEGQPLVGEVVRLSQREESDRLFDVEVLMKARPSAPPAQRTHKGPPRVSSNAFRSRWEEVFGASSERADEPTPKPGSLPS